MVSGFQHDPVGLLETDQADLVIVSKSQPRKEFIYEPLFRYESLALVAGQYPLARKDYLTASEFAREPPITYPIPDDRIDIIRKVLGPAGVDPARRTAILTVAILHFVASHCGITAIPTWAAQPYLDRGYVESRRVRKHGVTACLFAATTPTLASTSYMKEIVSPMKKVSFATIKGIPEA